MAKGEIFVSSMPRSGSTMLCRAIEGLPQSNTWNQNKAEIVWKSHRPSSPSLPYGCSKAIYVFGDPVLAVISTQNRFSKDKKHFRNCGCYKDLSDIDIYKRDEMNLEETFDSWYNREHSYPVCCVRYESIWKHKSKIEDFLDHNINLPEKRERNTTFCYDRDLELLYTYESLICKAEQAQDFKVER